MTPKFALIRQTYPAPALEDAGQAVRDAASSCGFPLETLRDKTVGIAVGSRGIANLPAMVRAAVRLVREHGGSPVVFAAMGSHGGGTAQGQREVLASLDITEETVETEIRTCADGVSYGRAANGMEVFGNPLARTFDRVILMNRVKPHTDFEDITESGIYKLLAIGIGNPAGADRIHANLLSMGYGPAIRAAGDLMLKTLPVAFALAITENWKHQTDSVQAILPERLLEEESRILREVKARTVRLPAEELDTLIIREAGKDISGTCVDTKVVGRIRIPTQPEPESPRIRTIAVLDFTDASHGNSMGLGVVDLITRRVFDKIDINATSLTGVTSKCLLQAKIPCVAGTDRQAIETAFTASGVQDPGRLRAMLIQNTNALERLYVSQAAYEALSDHPHIERLSEFAPLEFDQAGTLRRP